MEIGKRIAGLFKPKNIQEIDLKSSNPHYDFGSGFYMAVEKRDEISIFLKSKSRNNGKISKFIFNCKQAKDDGLNILEFQNADVKWLDFITDNRIYEKPHNYDIVIGPTADGNALLICNRYDKGMIDAEEAMEKLNTDQYSTQVLFHTESSLKYLKEVSMDFERLILHCENACAEMYGMQLYNVDVLFRKYDVPSFIELNRWKFETLNDAWIAENVWKYIESERKPDSDPFY